MRARTTGLAGASTVNAAITLVMPVKLDTEARASTVNGDIDSDYPLTVTGKFGPRRDRRRPKPPALHGGFSVLSAVFLVPEHRPTSDSNRYDASTSAA